MTDKIAPTFEKSGFKSRENLLPYKRDVFEKQLLLKVLCSGDREGSISVVGAVSPPGGDFSEPVTQNTLRIVKVFWALDSDLADRRHFPAINWLRSYSLYLERVKGWWEENVEKDWLELRNEAMALLQREEELQEIIRLVGPDALPSLDRVVLEGARVIREDFLQQNAFSEVEASCSTKKQLGLLEAHIHFYEKILKSFEDGKTLDDILQMPLREELANLKNFTDVDFGKKLNSFYENMDTLFQNSDVSERNE